MLWMPNKIYENEPFELEDDLESAILEVQTDLFGDERIYLDIKKKIGLKGKTKNIPDDYLIDLSSKNIVIVQSSLCRQKEPLRL